MSNKIALVIVPAAVAVTAVLVSLRMHFQPPTVPTFAIADAMDGATLGKGDNFNLLIRPTARVQGAVAARGFLLQGDQTRTWNPTFVVAEDGTVTLSGPVEKVFADVPPGPWEVAVIVGRPETLPSKADEVLRARDQYDISWRLVREHIILQP